MISKALARILRHTAASLKLAIRPDGFCSADELLRLPDLQQIGASLGDLQAVVNGNDKKRFELREEAGQVLVRAVQGHSMKAVADDQLLQRLQADGSDTPTVCVHGTYRRCVESIRRQGLLAGGGASDRNHVHFAPFEPGDGRVISGMRYNCEVAIYVDVARALREGVPFFRSANQVILSPGIQGVVPAKFISRIRDLQSRCDL